MHRILLGFILALATATSASAQPKFAAIHGASVKTYQEWINGLDDKNLRPVFVSVADIKGEPAFAAIAVENEGRKAWTVRHHLTPEKYQQEFEANTKKGGRPVSISGYRRGNATNYAVIFIKDDAKNWQARHGLTGKENQDVFNTLTKKEGFRPQQIVGHPVGDETRFSVIYSKDDVKNWIMRYGMKADEYQTLFNDFKKKNGRPISINAYSTKDGTRFAAVMMANTDKIAWDSKHHLTPKEYQAYFDDMTGKGYRPTQICAYPWEGEVRYMAVFEKN